MAKDKRWIENDAKFSSDITENLKMFGRVFQPYGAAHFLYHVDFFTTSPYFGIWV